MFDSISSDILYIYINSIANIYIFVRHMMLTLEIHGLVQGSEDQIYLNK